MNSATNLIIEGAGGLMVPLNEHEMVVDLIRKLGAKVILVNRNYPGSINHSLLTAQVCRQKNIKVLGWIFNDQSPESRKEYEDDIIQWTGFPRLTSINKLEKINKVTVRKEAARIKETLLQIL
jgi:dethiobiotin synthetase